MPLLSAGLKSIVPLLSKGNEGFNFKGQVKRTITGLTRLVTYARVIWCRGLDSNWGHADFQSAAEAKMVSNPSEMVSKFISSRNKGLSIRTLEFYKCYLGHALCVIGSNVNPGDIKEFIDNLECTNGGRHAYHRALRAFYNWLYSSKSQMGLNSQRNPMLYVDAPKVEKMILPSLSSAQVDYLIDQAENLRDKAIISLFADSGMRLSELANIKSENIDWQNCTITIWGKGHKQRKAPFTKRTAKSLKPYVLNNGDVDNIWHIKPWGIVTMLRRLEKKTGLPCNPHTFRRTFASNLHRAGIDIEHIMRLGGWESLDMVLRYTRSVKFEDSMKLYRQVTN